MTPLERAARAICGNSLSGFCANVGGHRGCKVGRGERFDGTNCVATLDQLRLSEHWEQAREAIRSIRDPGETSHEEGKFIMMTTPKTALTSLKVWQVMADALLAEGADK